MADVELDDRPDSIDVRVGRRIRERRRLISISQVRLAAMIGVSYQQLQKYEQGINRVAASRMAALAAALDVPPSYFFATGAPEIESGPEVMECLAAAQAASEAASELVRVAREGAPLPSDTVLARLVEAARILAELKPRPQDAELLAAIYRWNAERAQALDGFKA